jgi:hypothetical protein
VATFAISRYVLSAHPRSELVVVDLWSDESLRGHADHVDDTVAFAASADDGETDPEAFSPGGGGGGSACDAEKNAHSRSGPPSRVAAGVFERFVATVCAAPAHRRVRVVAGTPSIVALAALLTEPTDDDEEEGARDGGRGVPHGAGSFDLIYVDGSHLAPQVHKKKYGTF